MSRSASYESVFTSTGTPRFDLPYPNGEAGNPARPSLAGAAFAEAAEQAGTKLTGWVTGLVRSGEYHE